MPSVISKYLGFTGLALASALSIGGPHFPDVASLPPPPKKSRKSPQKPAPKALKKTQMHRVIGSGKFRSSLQNLVRILQTQEDENWYVHLGDNGAAWRGDQRERKSMTMTIEIPESFDPKICRFAYFHVTQHVRGYPKRSTDIGIVMHPSTGHGVLFATTEDPSLAMGHATFSSYKPNGVPNVVNASLPGEKYYCISKKSEHFQNISFTPGERVNMSIEIRKISPDRSLILLTLKSPERTVTASLFRNDEDIWKPSEIHPVVSATAIQPQDHVRLLIAATRPLTLSEVPKFPKLARLYADVSIEEARQKNPQVTIVASARE